MPDTTGKTGVEHFEDRIEALAQSPDTANAENIVQTGTGNGPAKDGRIVQQYRGGTAAWGVS